MSRLKLVSFDVWGTLLSVRAFYQSVASELAKITNKDSTFLEKGLIEGYKRIREIRRAGGFDDKRIVSMTLNAIAKFLDVDSVSYTHLTLPTICSV